MKARANRLETTSEHAVGVAQRWSSQHSIAQAAGIDPRATEAAFATPKGSITERNWLPPAAPAISDAVEAEHGARQHQGAVSVSTTGSALHTALGPQQRNGYSREDHFGITPEEKAARTTALGVFSASLASTVSRSHRLTASVADTVVEQRGATSRESDRHLLGKTSDGAASRETGSGERSAGGAITQPILASPKHPSLSSLYALPQFVYHVAQNSPRNSMNGALAAELGGTPPHSGPVALAALNGAEKASEEA